MSHLRLHTVPDPGLISESRPHGFEGEDTVELVRAMYRVMPRWHGIGLAAPQVGYSTSLFILDRTLFPRGVVINPVLVGACGLHRGWEGCLSIPGKRFRKTRFKYISFKAQDEYGIYYMAAVEGLAARAWQHENDHLHGVLLNRDEEGEDIERQ